MTRKIQNMRKSNAGNEVLVFFPVGMYSEIFTGIIDPVAYGGNFFVVQGIIAGDDYSKGISLIDINTGAELICLVPRQKLYKEKFDLYMRELSKGYVFYEELRAKRDALCVPDYRGSMPPCPYK